MFGLGMNNNGTGLVLASLALANHPKVMIPIIFYNLVQQVFAGYVHWTRNRDSFDRNGPERDRQSEKGPYPPRLKLYQIDEFSAQLRVDGMVGAPLSC
jgi:hypothetical protein